MVNAQTEHAKRFMFNSTNQVMRRMEQFRRVGINKSTGFKDIRLTLANNQNNYCTACFSGNYPIKIKEESGKEIF